MRVSKGPRFSWHDHRLAPSGAHGRFAIPVQVDGRPGVIAGTFVRVPRPAIWPWLVGAGVFAVAVASLARRAPLRVPLVVVLGAAAGAAALTATIAFAVRDRPGGGVGWAAIGTAAAVAAALAVPLLRLRGRRRATAAGVTGAVAAAVALSALPVFWHGIVVSALPARRVRGRLRRRRRRRSSVAPAGARRVRRLAALGLVAVAAAGCGGGSSTPATPTIPAARVTKVIDFAPGGSVAAGKPATISFRIQQADGSPLTKFRRGPGPHTGVHLIYVRDDLSTIIHHHPPLGGRGKIVDHVTFPAPGPYRLVIDVYPASCPGSATPAVPGAPAGTCNFQLFERVRVAGAYSPRPLPPTSKAQKDGGCRFTLDGAANLTAVVAQLVHMTVTCAGKPATFQTYYGALAHAIFFRKGSLDYFHTHVCEPGASGCTSFLGATRVTGRSATPGKLTVGVLVPVAGTWRLFLQVEVGGHILTAPFTLHVK